MLSSLACRMLGHAAHATSRRGIIMIVSTFARHATHTERTACLRDAIRRRVERQRAEKLRDLQDAVSSTWTDGLPGIRRSLTSG
jgi:hypothetical protein